MISKRTLIGWLAVCAVMGLVIVPASAGRYRPSTGGEHRWVYVYEQFNPVEIPRVEDVQTVARMEEGDELMEGVFGIVDDTTRAVGSTADSVYRTVVGAEKGAEDIVVAKKIEPAKPVEHTGLVEGTLESISGTAEAAGRTVGDTYSSVVEGKEIERAPRPAKPVEHTGLVEGTLESISGTADAAGRTVGDTYASVVEGKEIERVEEPKPEEHTGLFEGAWESITGTVDGIFAAIFGRGKAVEEAEAVPMGVPPAERPTEYRYYPRYHGRVGRWLPVE